MKRIALTMAAAVLAAGALTACSDDDDGDGPVPAGGINGPARVEPNSGASTGDDDDGG